MGGSASTWCRYHICVPWIHPRLRCSYDARVAAHKTAGATYILSLLSPVSAGFGAAQRPPFVLKALTASEARCVVAAAILSANRVTPSISIVMTIDLTIIVVRSSLDRVCFFSFAFHSAPAAFPVLARYPSSLVPAPHPQSASYTLIALLPNLHNDSNRDGGRERRQPRRLLRFDAQ